MPHYKNGREAKIGDVLVCKPQYGLPISGVVVAVNPSAETCNANVVPTTISQYVTLSDCLHIDDAFATEQK